jgi:hypothetical protein
MRTIFPSSKINLNVLVDKICDFFKTSGFSVIVERENRRVAVTAEFGQQERMEKFVKVTLEPSSDCSTTAILFDNLLNSKVAQRSSIFSLFGGGFWTLKNLRGAEAIDKLEKNFWAMVDALVGFV